MFGTLNLPEYALGALLIVLLPGPNSLYVLSVAARRGVRVGYRAAFGVFLGDTTLITVTALGAASLLARSPAAFDVIKYFGAGYLTYLGIGMLRSAIRALRSRRTGLPAEARPEAGVERPFHKALIVSLLNPKAILFFLAFFTQFVDPHAAHPAEAFALLGAIVQIFSLAYLSALILGGDRLAAVFRRRKRLAASMTAGVGSLFLGFAAKLATASLG
ncbi:leucine efflux protein LeuE [Kitasatospora sp. NPDC052896]|uniref:leucine efflux protein LeuE n=1 Tax=Kitasatospora sp. NPDC052896 TaxID=3364061 RepID=UPI0037CA73BF